MSKNRSKRSLRNIWMSHQGNLQGFQKIFATFTSDQCKSIRSQIENEIKIAEGVGSLKTMVVLDDISQSSAENTRGSSGKKSTKKRSLKAIHGMFLECWNTTKNIYNI